MCMFREGIGDKEREREKFTGMLPYSLVDKILS